VEAVNSLLIEDRVASVLRLIELSIKTATVPVVVDVLEALEEPRGGFYAMWVVSTAAIRWKSSAALFELLEALHNTTNSERNLRTAYENIGIHPSKRAVAGLLKLLREAGQRNDVLQILVKSSQDHRPGEVSELLKELREGRTRPQTTCWSSYAKTGPSTSYGTWRVSCVKSARRARPRICVEKPCQP
jgi:hypothetical protein